MEGRPPHHHSQPSSWNPGHLLPHPDSYDLGPATSPPKPTPDSSRHLRGFQEIMWLQWALKRNQVCGTQLPRSTHSIQLNQAQMRYLLKNRGCTEYILTSSSLSSPSPYNTTPYGGTSAVLKYTGLSACSFERLQRSFLFWISTHTQEWNVTHWPPFSKRFQGREAAIKLKHWNSFQRYWLLQGITYKGYEIGSSSTRQRWLPKAPEAATANRPNGISVRAEARKSPLPGFWLEWETVHWWPGRWMLQQYTLSWH